MVPAARRNCDVTTDSPLTCVTYRSLVFACLRSYDSGRFAGPGHWIISDMLEVGNGMTVDEDTAHFTLWCVSVFGTMLI
jgi:hypothetical protein